MDELKMKAEITELEKEVTSLKKEVTSLKKEVTSLKSEMVCNSINDQLNPRYPSDLLVTV